MFKFLPILFCQPDVAILRAFVAAAEEHNQCPTLLAQIHPIAGPMVDAQFGHAFTDGLAIAQVSLSHAGQPGEYPRHSQFVIQAVQPFVEWHFAGP